MKNRIFALALGLCQLTSVGSVAALSLDEQQITRVMAKEFDKPAGSLKVVPISVEGDYAVAGWLQGGRGGRAFLEKYKNQWAISVCGGAGLAQADVLQTIGMKSDAAMRLAAAVVAAEGKLGADQRRLFDGFEGMVKIDAAPDPSAHGQHGKHTGHKAPALK
jgi:hypothetical protein